MSVYGVIAEDPSDVEILKVLIRRLSNNSSLPVKGKGYGGCGEMLRKGATQLGLFADLGCKRFIICYDADGPDAAAHKKEIIEKIIKPSKLPQTSCLALVPVQEIEAWILADIDQAVPKVIPSWKPDAVKNPEGIANPKEHLEQLSRGSNKKPRYTYTVHNSQVTKHLNLQTVSKQCQSFRPLEKFVAGSRKIKLPSQDFPGSRQGSLFPYVGASGDSQYLPGQLTTAHQWGSIITYVQNLHDEPEELSRLCGFGWADLEKLEAELQTIQSKSKPKGQVRAILKALHGIAKNRQDARYIGLDDGTR